MSRQAREAKEEAQRKMLIERVRRAVHDEGVKKAVEAVKEAVKAEIAYKHALQREILAVEEVSKRPELDARTGPLAARVASMPPEEEQRRLACSGFDRQLGMPLTWLQRLREAHNITCRELSVVTGVPMTTIKKAEKGQAWLSLNALRVIAKVFNVANPNKLMDRDAARTEIRITRADKY